MFAGEMKSTRRATTMALFALMLIGLGACTTEDESASTQQGYVEGEFLYMAAPMGGILQELNVQDGQTVTSGTVLFSLDSQTARAAVAEAKQKLAQGQSLLEDARLGKRPSEIQALEAQLKQAQAALAFSIKTFERQKILYSEKTISAEELDQARSRAQQDQQRASALESEIQTARLGARTHQVAAAEANVKALQAALAQQEWILEQTTQVAPQDALVFETYYYPGEFVAAGRPVVSVLPPGNIRVRTFVPEAMVGSLQLGSAATVSVDGVEGRFHGKITFISPKAEFTPPVIYSRQMRQKLSFLVELTFPHDEAVKLHPGQPVDVEFEGISP